MSHTQREIPAKRAQEIVQLAEAIANENCPTGKVDPEVIIRAEKIQLIFDHYDDEFDGMLEYEDGGFSIHCNLDRENVQGSPRGRFTLGHELGHYFIDDHRAALISGNVRPHPSFADKPSGDSIMEREADFFASHLLMPPARFADALLRAGKHLTGIKNLASKFDVSVTCAAIRYVVEEIEPCVLIKWSSDGFGWKWISPQFRAKGYRVTLSEIRELPAVSWTRACLSSKQTRSGVIGGKIAAHPWFRSTAEAKDLVVREEAIKLGRFGVLTLLTFPDGCFPSDRNTSKA